MTKLIIQIPCYNEEAVLGLTISELLKVSVPDVDQIEIMVVDDGSTDRTVEVAWNAGAHHVVSLGAHQGLARAFSVGLDHALSLGVDVLVNTDADNQYPASEIPNLVRPILEKQSHIVIGCRKIDEISSFSPLKKFLQKLGSWVVRRVSGTQVEDATTGFRAYSRFAMMRVNVFSNFSYTLETIIQAGILNIPMAAILVSANPETRESRLAKSIPHYLWQSGRTILRIAAMYRAFLIFLTLGVAFLTTGALGFLFFLYYYVTVSGPTGHVQLVVFSGTMLVIGMFLTLAGLLADMINTNRTLLQDALFRIKRMEMEDRFRS
jgi:glycosyltransferase involved in cell wall biosynthesis